MLVEEGLADRNIRTHVHCVLSAAREEILQTRRRTVSGLLVCLNEFPSFEAGSVSVSPPVGAAQLCHVSDCLRQGNKTKRRCWR